MKYFFVVGEASGDLHASNVMAALKKMDSQAEFQFLGGDLMQSQGGTLVKHYREMAFMGVVPVLLNAKTILRNMKVCKKAITDFQPDVVILVDYPGFNLKIAEFVKTELNLPVHYYISPKIWAWKKYRIRSFRRFVDRMFCILPFEKEFYRALDYPVDYVGNPSVDAITSFRDARKQPTNLFLSENKLNEKPILAILSGSRKQEIKKNLPLMLEVAQGFHDYQCVVAGAPGLNRADYEPYIKGTDTPLVFGQTYDLLEHSFAAMVTSGTATLEATLFRVPQVVCYYFWGGKLVNFIYHNFFHVPYISLVNLIAGREIVQELFGGKFTREKVYHELKNILQNVNYKEEILKGYDEVISILGPAGASERTASLIVQSLHNQVDIIHAKP